MCARKIKAKVDIAVVSAARDGRTDRSRTNVPPTLTSSGTITRNIVVRITCACVRYGVCSYGITIITTTIVYKLCDDERILFSEIKFVPINAIVYTPRGTASVLYRYLLVPEAV